MNTADLLLTFNFEIFLVFTFLLSLATSYYCKKS